MHGHFTAVFEETVTCPGQAQAIFRTYAHHYHNRLLVTEVEIHRASGFSGAINVAYENLNGVIEEEIEYASTGLTPEQPYQDEGCADTELDCR